MADDTSPSEVSAQAMSADGTRRGPDFLRSVGVLLLRLTVGGLLAGHGAQKLLGWFEGGGIAATESQMESLGLTPAWPWARFAALSELGGGLLTMLGLLNPVGPLLATGSMLVATLKVHAGKPIWNTKGGAELPITNLAALVAVMAIGPGALSLDRVLGVRLPRILALPGLLTVGGLTWLTLQASANGSPKAGRKATRRRAKPEGRCDV